MDFIDKIRELSARIPKQLEHIQTEEATKNALIMPFIAALGYNVFDPTEVTPELNADVGIKKGKRLTMLSYAIASQSCCLSANTTRPISGKCMHRSSIAISA